MATKPVIPKTSAEKAQDFLIDFALGGFSGAIAKTITAPIERVKLIIQTQDANPRIISGEVKRYSGIVDCFTRVSREQGLLAFWRGNFTNVIRYFPTQAFNFAFKDFFKTIFPRYNSKTEFLKFVGVQIASGSLAGAGSLCIVYPLDYARTRLASDVGSGARDFNGLLDCLRKTSSGPKGPLALYNGFGVSVLGIIPYRGVYFGMFDTLTALNPYHEGNSPISLLARFACAQVTAITAGYASYPFDTVRRRLQMQSEKPREQWVYANTLDCFGKVYSKEGFRAFFKGAGANALRTVGSAMVLVFYESGRQALGIRKSSMGGGG